MLDDRTLHAGAGLSGGRRLVIIRRMSAKRSFWNGDFGHLKRDIAISAVTDAVLEEIAEWQNRPLEPLYALAFFDAIRVKVRDEGMVRNKAV